MSENGTAAVENMNLPRQGEFCWTEIAAANLEANKTFYTKVFGWYFHQSENPDTNMQYLEFGTDEASHIGGMYEPNAEMCKGTIPPPHFMNYIAVEDVDDAAGKAFDLGGKIVVPPMNIPNVGRFCVVEDPTGAKFSIITLGGGK
jgi:predicted enzyme related to lactoylglutathione lyase